MSREERIKMVKAMEFVVRHINDEDVFMPWLYLGVADGDIPIGDLSVNPDDEAEYYIDDERFSDIMSCFLFRISAAKKSGGLYCDGVVSK